MTRKSSAILGHISCPPSCLLVFSRQGPIFRLRDHPNWTQNLLAALEHGYKQVSCEYLGGIVLHCPGFPWLEL